MDFNTVGLLAQEAPPCGNENGFPTACDSNTVAARGFSRCTPHTPAGHKTTVRGRSPGLRVNAFVRLPNRLRSVTFGRSLAGYSCGGSRGFGPRSLNLARQGGLCAKAMAGVNGLSPVRGRAAEHKLKPEGLTYKDGWFAARFFHL